MEDTTMIDPLFRATIWHSAIWQSQWLDLTLESMILSKALSGIWEEGPKYGLTAALHQDVKFPKMFTGLIHQVLKLLLI